MYHYDAGPASQRQPGDGAALCPPVLADQLLGHARNLGQVCGNALPRVDQAADGLQGRWMARAALDGQGDTGWAGPRRPEGTRKSAATGGCCSLWQLAQSRSLPADLQAALHQQYQTCIQEIRTSTMSGGMSRVLDSSSARTCSARRHCTVRQCVSYGLQRMPTLLPGHPTWPAGTNTQRHPALLWLPADVLI